jgi:hypothetical protein
VIKVQKRIADSQAPGSIQTHTEVTATNFTEALASSASELTEQDDQPNDLLSAAMDNTPKDELSRHSTISEILEPVETNKETEVVEIEIEKAPKIMIDRIQTSSEFLEEYDEFKDGIVHSASNYSISSNKSDQKGNRTPVVTSDVDETSENVANAEIKEENTALRLQIQQISLEKELLLSRVAISESRDVEEEQRKKNQLIKKLEQAAISNLTVIAELRDTLEAKEKKVKELEIYKRHSILQLHHLTKVVEDMEMELCDMREIVNVDETRLMREKLAVYKKQVLEQKKQVKQTLERMEDEDSDDLTKLVRVRTMHLLDFYMHNLEQDKEVSTPDALSDDMKEQGTKEKAERLIDAVTAFLLERFTGTKYFGTNHLWDYVEAARNIMKEGHQKQTRVLRGDELRCYYAISSIVIVTQNSPERKDDLDYKWKTLVLMAMKYSRMKEWLNFLLGFNDKLAANYFAKDSLFNQPKKRGIVNTCFSQVDKLPMKINLDPVIEKTFNRFVEKSREQVPTSTTTPVTPVAK